MNIESSGPFFKVGKAAADSKPSPAKAAGAGGAGPATSASNSNSAGAGSAAGAASAASQLFSTHADFDAAKVAEIRASISAGRYMVNTDRIADGLLASAQELLQSPRP